jgi:aryl-alcohol dehydrogenase-like predicted oxidoreductase
MPESLTRVANSHLAGYCLPRQEKRMDSSPPVPRRQLGRTGLSIPVIPFGTQGFGGNFGPVSDEEAVALIRRAVELGVNHFDSARCYGDSLRKLALALREIPRDEVILTGRVCCHSAARWGGYGEGRPDFSAQRAMADVEDQLELLGITYFDGVLIHDPPDMEPTLAPGGTLEGLLRLKACRLTRNVGYGMRPHDFHLAALATDEIDFFLCFSDYNLLRQTAADRLLPAAAEAGVGVLNGWSIMQGLLTGVDIAAAQAAGRWTTHKDAPKALAIQRWCREEGIDMLTLALRFCLREERIHGNPIGSLNIAQLEANVRAATTPLPEEVWQRFGERFLSGVD